MKNQKHPKKSKTKRVFLMRKLTNKRHKYIYYINFLCASLQTNDINIFITLNMSQLVHFFFQLQTQLKLYHWQTTSYARHKASDSLVDSLLELSDKFMEVYIGKYGRPTLSDKDATMTLKNLNDSQIVPFVKRCISFLMEELPKMINKKDHDLISIRDDMLVEMNQAIYLFTLH
jgi:hypothetical protein